MVHREKERRGVGKKGEEETVRQSERQNDRKNRKI